jgi:hypothetical protein
MLDVFIGNKMDAPVRVPRLRKNCHKIHNTGLTRDGQPSFWIKLRVESNYRKISRVVLFPFKKPPRSLEG